jgi:hypothetical protein
MSFRSRRGLALAVTAGIVAATALGAPADARRAQPQPTEDSAHYILPPGNYGGLPTTDESITTRPTTAPPRSSDPPVAGSSTVSPSGATDG